MRRYPIAILAALALFLACAFPAVSLAQALKLYWADEFAGRIYKSDPDGSNLTTLITGDLLNSAEVVLGGGKLYWSDAERGLIQRANTDGTGLETVVHTIEPGALGLDMAGGKLYWIDRYANEIRRADLDGTGIETVRYLTHPATALTIAETSQQIYWGEYDSGLAQAVVHRQSIASALPQQLAVFPGTAEVRGLTVNEADGWVYFGLGSELRRMDTAGGSGSALYAGGSEISAVAPDVPGGKLYWADSGNHDVTRSEPDGTGVEVLETFARNVDGLAVDAGGAALFWTEERFVVRSALDGTGQTHVVARPSYLAVGFHDGLDRIYYSDLQKLETHYANADGSDPALFWSGVSVATGGALAIQVDHVADKVYWLDGGDRWLRQADPDGSNRQDVMHLPGDAYDIALDVVGARVYWCGRSTGSIYRHNLDASGVTETLYSGLNLPKGLTLDFALGRLIWGEDDQIAHAPLGGGGPVDVAYTDPFVVIGVVWDEADNRLYWADQLNSRVRRGAWQAGAGGWLPAETLFSMGFEHWPGRLALQHSIVSGVGDVAAAPSAEHHAVPNPFNPTTTVHFRLAAAGAVTVGIYDLRGRLVRGLVRGAWMPAGPGRVVWDGKDASGRTLASGVYMYRIESGADPLLGKLVLMK